MMKLYKDRLEAGDRLAEELSKRGIHDALVLGIPRGGVVVAAKVAEKLGFPLDIIIPRKIGAPFNPEVAAGAVTQDGTVLLNQVLMESYNISREEIAKLLDEQIKEIKRRMVKYRGSDDYRLAHSYVDDIHSFESCPPDGDALPLLYKNKTILLVDDGIATGFTVKAAIASIKNIFKPREIILAVPVAPPDTIKALSSEVDAIICPLIPDDFHAVGQFYIDFDQIGDDEVKELLKKN